jgi:hypothetical protein
MKASLNKVKFIALEILGWLLVLLGIAALVLPGPGLLALFAGLTILSTRYEWARRRVEPVKASAIKAARDGVSSTLRLLSSSVAVLGLIGIGIVWGLQPSSPAWWPLNDKYWLFGGWGTGAVLIGSGILAGAMLVYSYLNFRKD